MQTLSRLNRTPPQKGETMVLDFVNETDTISDAFEPHYETTTLSEGTDPNMLHDLERRLLAPGIVTEPDLDRYAEIDVNASLSETEKRKRAENVVNDCVDRYDAAPKEEQDDFREALGKFIRLYAFLAQVLPSDDIDLEKLYRIGRPLLPQILAHMEPSAVAEDELQELIDDNFTLYKKIVDNDAFASLLFDSLFDRCVETVEENNEYPPPCHSPSEFTRTFTSRSGSLITSSPMMAGCLHALRPASWNVRTAPVTTHPFPANCPRPMQVDTRYSDGTLIIEVGGDWSIDRSLPDIQALVVGAAPSSPVTTVAFDTSELGDWDSSLVTFLFETVEYSRAHDLDVQTDTLPSSLARLVSLSQAVPEQDTSSEAEDTSLLARLGHWGLDVYDEVFDFVTFTGRAVRSLGALLTGQSQMRWRVFGVALQSSTSSALPIVTIISLLIGLIIAFLGAVVLQRFGADYYVSYLVSYGVLRELGALMTAIIMTGRTGAAFAAELGSMKVNEEIDALDTFGISPIDFLVTPRILAVVLALPMLTIYADIIGIVGGMGVAVTMLDVTTTQFLMGLLEPIVLSDVLIGIVKAVVYGGIIGLAGCMRGLQTGDDASAVGSATTSAVVTGIILVVLANAVIDWIAAVLQV